MMSGAAMVVVTLGVMLTGTRSTWAQPAPDAPGCCCVAGGGSYACADKTQAACLKLQPAVPTFPKLADWKKAWSDAVSASKAQAAAPMQGGWIAESCEKAEARTGCCCFPKLHPTEGDRSDCKPAMSEFDCKAECAQLRDGQLPSGCTWSVGACQR